MPFRPSERVDIALQTACLGKAKHLMLVYFTRRHTVSTILPLCIASSESLLHLLNEFLRHFFRTIVIVDIGALFKFAVFSEQCNRTHDRLLGLLAVHPIQNQHMGMFACTGRLMQRDGRIPTVAKIFYTGRIERCTVCAIRGFVVIQMHGFTGTAGKQGADLSLPPCFGAAWALTANAPSSNAVKILFIIILPKKLNLTYSSIT